MKLVEREIGLEIELKENVVSVIVVENVGLRLPMIEGLYSQVMGKEGRWLLVENEKNFDLGKMAEIILEPFSLELNNKKVKTKLYQDIKEITQDNFFSQGLEVHSKICGFFEELFEKVPYPIQYEEDWNIIELLKAYGVQLEEAYDNLYEKIFDYISLVTHLCGIRIFIMINIKQYLSEEQLSELYKLAKYIKIQLVLIEFDVGKTRHDCEDVYILDKDCCIISY